MEPWNIRLSHLLSDWSCRLIREYFGFWSVFPCHKIALARTSALALKIAFLHIELQIVLGCAHRNLSELLIVLAAE